MSRSESAWRLDGADLAWQEAITGRGDGYEIDFICHTIARPLGSVGTTTRKLPMSEDAFAAHGFRCEVRVEPARARWIAWIHLEPLDRSGAAVAATRLVPGSFTSEAEARNAADVYAKVVIFSDLGGQ